MASVDATTGGRYAESTLRAYATSARVASKAIRGFIGSRGVRPGTAEARRELDRPYNDQLEGLIQNANLRIGGFGGTLEPRPSRHTQVN